MLMISWDHLRFSLYHNNFDQKIEGSFLFSMDSRMKIVETAIGVVLTIENVNMSRQFYVLRGNCFEFMFGISNVTLMDIVPINDLDISDSVDNLMFRGNEVIDALTGVKIFDVPLTKYLVTLKDDNSGYYLWNNE